MKFKKIDIGRQGNFILGLLLIHFLFFGYLSNVYINNIPADTIGDGILFLYKVMFSPISFLSAIFLFLIIFFMTFRENFFEYGMRNSIWTIPFIIVESWIWYWFINGFNIALIGVYFIRIESYLTILTLVALVLSATFLGAITKEKYKAFKEKALTITTERL
ncbi:MAG: hypothetical protein KAX18_05200 [Candidatus Lokiarchaeota archaeon]|nr:hypothetical protein [Candidatus Lokiarchaeota archaeon]